MARPGGSNLSALAAHAVTLQGISSHGSLVFSPATSAHHTSRRIYNQHRTEFVPYSLPSRTITVLTFCLNHQFSMVHSPTMPSFDLISLVGSSREASTLDKYVSYFLPWLSFARDSSIPALPVSPFVFAEFLTSSASNNRTVSPTLSRCTAISYFCSLAGSPSPMDHVLCQTIREALRRRLGTRGHKKFPLMRTHVNSLLERLLSASTSLATLLFCFQIAIMYEGCLRWCDLAQLLFGDIVITNSYLRLFIEQSKTDVYRQGQWVTLPLSRDPFSAYSLLLRLMDALIALWQHSSPPMRFRLASSLPLATLPMDLSCPARDLTVSIANSQTLPLRRIPLIFAVSPMDIPHFSRTSSYQSFLHALKAWAARDGHDPVDIGTHSLRRGLASDWALIGVPDRLRMVHGRWRSAIVADGYIDESVNIQQCLQIFHSSNPGSAAPSVLSPHIVALPSSGLSSDCPAFPDQVAAPLPVHPPHANITQHPALPSNSSVKPSGRPARAIRRPNRFDD